VTATKPGIRVGTMIRISITYFYDIAKTLHPIGSINPGPLNLWWSSLYAARTSLQGLFNTAWFGPAIQNSYDSGQRLLRAVAFLTDQDYGTYQITPLDVFSVTDSLHEFETVLRAELSNADCYYVTRKAGYDTKLLVMNAEQIFPNDLSVKVSEAAADIREAGRCLGYEASTAAGFHIMRALEGVVRKYWDAVSNGKPRPKNKTLGGYLKQLNVNNLGDVKIRAVLQQIKDLHRNPLAHPGGTISLDEAVGLFGIAHSAIGAMLGQIPAPPTPALSALSGLAAAFPSTPSGQSMVLAP
jgi:hypothetical protein